METDTSKGKRSPGLRRRALRGCNFMLSSSASSGSLSEDEDWRGL